MIENVPAPIFVKGASDRRYILVNRAGEKFWGASRAEMIGKTSYEVFPKKEADLIAARDEQLLQSNQPVFEERQILTPRNGIRSIMSKRLVVCDDDGKSRYVVGVIEDVTERKRAEERIAHLAHHDALTDLPNRLLFTEQLEQALTRVRRGERLAVLYIDLDHFKGVNDTLGHAIGDELLKGVAGRLRGCAREIDSIARLSGDEFAIIQTSIERPSDAAALATRIREAIKAPYDFNDQHAVVDSSIGISIAPNDSTEPDELLKAADMALYEAKTGGRGTYCFYEPEMDTRVKARSKLELDLRTALSRGEFELFYQPIVNLKNNRISTCEALLRWRHPERGVISPAEFIPVAEEIGIIIQLGEWLLGTACAEAAAWPDDIKVAVNFSPTQLTSSNTVQMVIRALAASGLPANRLELEITESVFMRNTFTTLATLHQLGELGVRIAMDDFGTGYSSLSYLLSFPFNKIKIDRCFIKGLTEGDSARAIVRAVANLAASLGMITTAEGVETEQQLEQIRLLGCTEMQGDLFSPPSPAAEIFQLLLSHADGAERAA
jgi:diguanylate cyclase (GGDEF)-like protein/PAS domain S-box-containing protein